MFLGIDVGTSKVAAVIIDGGRRVIASASREHGADIRGSPGRSEQDVQAIFAAALLTVQELPPNLRRQVQAVGVTGQMHGVVVLDEHRAPLTPLITWQDGRCLEGDFLARLSARCGHRLGTGFGCATLAWLVEHQALPAGAAASATVQDVLVAALCGESRPVTDPTDAASWGLLDLRWLDWDCQAVQKALLPPWVLPRVVPCGTLAGKAHPQAAGDLGVPAGVPVAVAIGDNQASLLATLEDPRTDLALTLGTGGQVSAVLPADVEAGPLPPNCTYEYRPFPGGRMLVVAASLCGGAAWAWLADAVIRWFEDFAAPAPPRDQVFQRLNQLGAQAKGTLELSPHFLGERYDESLRGGIRGIGLGNFDLGNLARATARGIVGNLKAMLPAHALTGRRRVVGSGNALRRNPLLRAMAEEVFGLPLKLSDSQEEAATGAAINAMGLVSPR
jgi:sedoheptulokinase